MVFTKIVPGVSWIKVQSPEESVCSELCGPFLFKTWPPLGVKAFFTKNRILELKNFFLSSELALRIYI